MTGGSQGIGKACSMGIAKAGANVVFGDINTEKGKQFENEWRKEKTESDGEITFVYYDARKPEDCKNLVKFVIQKYKTIDVLFNNVGVQPPESCVPLHNLDEKMWDFIHDVNLKSYYLVSKEVLPHMISKKSGHIINNASIIGLHSQQGAPAYASAKGGVLSLTRSLAVEYGGVNIHVNSISPGTIGTQMSAANTNYDDVLKNTPLGRIGSVDEVAQLVVFLSSASWITGQNFVIDGGITIKGGWKVLNPNWGKL